MLKIIPTPQNKILVRPAPPPTPEDTTLFAPLNDPATEDQIREYLRLSGDMDSFRTRWVASLDRNRSLGAPSWRKLFGQMDNLKLAKTLETVNKTYAVYKPQIKVARVRYMAEHPEYVDK